MTWYRVTHDGALWAETSDKEEAREHYGYALNELPGERIILQRWYEPPKPVGHWIDVQWDVSSGENGLTRPTD
jgi:hypothetical protein